MIDTGYYQAFDSYYDFINIKLSVIARARKTRYTNNSDEEIGENTHYGDVVEQAAIYYPSHFL